MLLYKYCRPDRVDTLKTGKIALTRPRAFNDPFDLSPHLATFDDPFAMQDHLHERTSNFVVLSLSENRESLLMWAHYTDSYRGFLIGFDDTGGILQSESSHRDFAAMFYCHHRPSHERFKEVSNQELFYTKASDWAYEREWRIVDSLLSADGDAYDKDQNCWPFKIRPEAVKEVIVGFRGDMAAHQIASILREPRYDHVKMLVVVPDQKRFLLEFIEMDKHQWPLVPKP